MAEQRHRIPDLVFWAVWLGILGSVLVVQHRLGGGIPRGRNADGALPPPAVLVLSGAFALASIFFRWRMIPGQSDRKKALVLMVAGLAFANALADFGIFLVPAGYPQTKLAYFVAALCCILMLAPTFLEGPPAPPRGPA